MSLMHYEDSAAGDIISGGTAAVPVRSTFQTDTFALKMILRGSWAMRAAGHIQVTNGVTWLATSNAARYGSFVGFTMHLSLSIVNN
jgi:hypothetical protein